MREGGPAEYVLLSVLGVTAVCFMSWLVSRNVLDREALRTLDARHKAEAASPSASVGVTLR